MEAGVRLRLGVVVAVLVVLAGCSSPPSGGDTATPTAVDVPDDPPPGVDTLGVRDANALAAAHSRALENASSYTFERTHVERWANGTVRSRYDESLAYVQTADRFHYVRSVAGAGDRVRGLRSGRYERWSNGSVAVERFAPPDGESSARILTTVQGEFARIDRPVAVETTQSQTLYSLFVVSNGTDVRRVDGSYRIEAYDVNPRSAVNLAPPTGVRRSAASDVHDVSFVVLARPDGLVTAFELRYTASVAGDVVTVTRRVQYDDVGATTVPRPDWVERLVERCVAAGGSPDDARVCTNL